MSVDMYVSSSQSQAASVAAICQQQKQGYEQLQRAINGFVLSSPQLQGAAYDSAKQFFVSVLSPLSKGGILLAEAVMEACQRFPEAYMATVDSGDLKESELIEKIEQLNRQMSELSDLQNRLQTLLFSQQQAGALDGSIASRLSGNHSLMATYSIRALYGHSIPMKIVKEEAIPPKFLYHGTAHIFLSEIKKNGLSPMSRQYVHLSEDIETAILVGKRKDKNPIILVINTENARIKGTTFYLGNEKVWLADSIPSEFLELLKK